MRPGTIPAATRIVALIILAGIAGPARALRLAENGFTVSPGEVLLTRTITVTATLENDHPPAGDLFGMEVMPVPGELVRLVGLEPPPAFTCTETGGTTTGRWIFEALAPGTVTFALEASQQQCRSELSDTPVHAVSPPIHLLPLPVWTSLACVPAFVAPGAEFALVLTLRNDAAEEGFYQPPHADAELGNRRTPAAQVLGAPTVEPATALHGNRLVLPPGREVVFRWRCRARETGTQRFEVVGAGLIMRSRPVTIRTPAAFTLTVPAPAVPTALGREYTVRAVLRTGGDAAVAAPGAAITWSPPDAARLVTAAPVTATLMRAEGPEVAVATFILEPLKPGPLLFSVSAWGTEADSGASLHPPTATRMLAVQAPPRLEVGIAPLSATALVGSRVPFGVTVRNRASAATGAVAPLVLFKAGTADLHAFAPMYIGVPAGGTSFFAGAMTPGSPGAVEFAVQATARDDRGGPWITAVSPAAVIMAVPVPRFEVYPLTARAWQGTTATVRFSLVNAARDRVRVTAATVSLAGTGAGSNATRLRPVPLVLEPGASATLAASIYLPPAKAPYAVAGSLSLSATLTAFGLPFLAQPGARTAVLACPRTTGFVSVEPDGAFRPPRDPVMRVEWTQTFAGEAGCALLKADGTPVRSLGGAARREAGWHEITWDGRDGADAVVPPGKYLLRVAGTSASAWHADHQFSIEKP